MFYIKKFPQNKPETSRLNSLQFFGTPATCWHDVPSAGRMKRKMPASCRRSQAKKEERTHSALQERYDQAPAKECGRGAPAGAQPPTSFLLRVKLVVFSWKRLSKITSKNKILLRQNFITIRIPFGLFIYFLRGAKNYVPDFLCSVRADLSEIFLGLSLTMRCPHIF